MIRRSLFLIFFLISSVAIPQTILQGKVVSIADGDTVTILTADNKQVKIRLHGIDCPERNQDFGTKARQFTSDLVFGKTVKVVVTDTDRYGRSVGLVILPDGRVLNKELLRAGLAWHYKHYDKSKEFAELEDQAKVGKLGIWSMRNAIAPWEFRKMGR